MSADTIADLRREILRALYLRRAAALSAQHLTTILRRKTGDQGLTEEAVKTEIGFFVARGEIETTRDDLGSASYHSLTPAGVLYCERNDLAD